MLYAITDIETTGGHAAGNGITEIAVYIHDGQRVVDRFETLVNPGQSIPYFIQRLTGITEEMVALAPRFEDLAPRLYGLLQGKVFVAHNVNFDYSFLLHHLQANGFQLNCKKLCTVRYSRKLLPGLPSYSLGNLCRHLSIPLQHRHRATGDAQATVQLFELLCSKDVNNIRHTLLSRQSGEHNLPLFVNREEVERLPVGPGVYYFHDAKGKVIYVGKAVRLKQRVLGHFSTNNATRQRQEFIRNIHRISYRVCGTGLMASVLEAVEIKRLWPKYNKATKQPEAAYGWYIYEDNGGYLRLAVDRKRRHLPAVQLFFNPTEARGALRRFADAHALCYKRCFIDRTGNESCVAPHCSSACQGAESPESYNGRLRVALDAATGSLPSFAIREPSWFDDSDACILMDQGRFYGMGYLPRDQEVQSGAELRERLTPYPEYDAVRNLLHKYALQKPASVQWLPG